MGSHPLCSYNFASFQFTAGFLYWDYKFFRPFFIRKFTQQELKDGKSHVTKLTDKWFHDIQVRSPFILICTGTELSCRRPHLSRTCRTARWS